MFHASARRAVLWYTNWGIVTDTPCSTELPPAGEALEPHNKCGTQYKKQWLYPEHQYFENCFSEEAVSLK
jgi:hypothetical protein